MQNFKHELIETEIKGSILTIALNRPEKRNAINDGLILGLETIFDQIPDTIRCVVIYGIGKHFSAGLDLSELQERNAVQGLHHSRMWHRVLPRFQ